MAPVTIITGVRPAGLDHDVLTLVTTGGKFAYRRRVCSGCPWRKDAPVGEFPAEAYRHSANVAYDMSDHKFGCHMSGRSNPRTCAGFLIAGAFHNLAVRLALFAGTFDPDKVSTDVELYEDYRAMAVANGVDPNDPVLKGCR